MIAGVVDLFRSLVALPAYRRELERRARQETTIAEHVNTALHCQFGPLYIMPFQVPQEITPLLELIAARRPLRLLEIGSSKGGTLYLFARVASPQATLVTIDLPGHWLRGPYPKWKEPLYRSFASPGQTIVTVRGDSHDARTVERVQTALQDTPVDFLFIDGDHAYEGVKDDFERYRVLVRRDGLIAFHDIVPGQENVGGVPRYWQELRAQYVHREFVDSWTQGGFGIGVLEGAGRHP